MILFTGMQVELSSTSPSVAQFSFEGAKAVDGIYDPLEEEAFLSRLSSIARTNVEVMPWIQVDLSTNRCVRSVVVFSRTLSSKPILVHLNHSISYLCMMC